MIANGGGNGIADRRKLSRVKLRLPVWLIPPGDSPPIETETVDISRDGFYCMTDHPFEPGTQMRCVLLLSTAKRNGSRQVRLEVGRTGSGVRLHIQDDGKGFDPDGVPDGHLGLAGMRARADKIGAQFSCRSEPGQGTTIEVFVPDQAIAAAGTAPAVAAGAAIRDA